MFLCPFFFSELSHCPRPVPPWVSPLPLSGEGCTLPSPPCSNTAAHQVHSLLSWVGGLPPASKFPLNTLFHDLPAYKPVSFPPWTLCITHTICLHSISLIIIIPQLESNTHKNNPNPFWSKSTPGSNSLFSALPQSTHLSIRPLSEAGRW